MKTRLMTRCKPWVTRSNGGDKAPPSIEIPSPVTTTSAGGRRFVAAVPVQMLALVLASLVVGRRGWTEEEPEATAEVAPVARVQTLVAAETEISETRSAYGTVVAGAAARQTVVAPLEVRVASLSVVAGQRISAGDPVAEVEPSPDTLLAWQQARDAEDAAARTLASLQEQYALELVTTQELASAQTAARDAWIKHNDLLVRGADGRHLLPAPLGGVVVRLDAVPGQIIPVGGALLEIDDPRQAEVRFGVDPRDLALLDAGTRLTLSLAGNQAAPPVAATIRMVAGQVDPDTRLIAAFASLPPDLGWLLGTPVEVRITLTPKRTLVVPRAAALEDDGRYTLYTVNDGHAVRHVVTLGLQNNQAVEVAGAKPPLQAGDAVVIQGNYELEDGMDVQVVAAP